MSEKRGCSSEQRLWIRRRDSQDMQHPEGCRCQFHSYTESGRFQQCDSKLETTKIEIHHIYPQSQQKRSPKRYGGENPYNLIALCAGEKGKIGHHDLMSPQMIIAKTRYQYDRNSFEDSLSFIAKVEDAGIAAHDNQFDGMLKNIARVRTDIFLKRFPADKFPYRKNLDDQTSLANNGVIFDNHVTV